MIMNPKIRTAIGADGVERVVVRCRECGAGYATGNPVVHVGKEAWDARVAFDKIETVAMRFVPINVIIFGVSVIAAVSVLKPCCDAWFGRSGDATPVHVMLFSVTVAALLMGPPFLFVHLKWRWLVRNFPTLKGTRDKIQPLP